MKMQQLAGAALVITGAALLSAHVGSPDTYYEGKAGPYGVQVVIVAPQVIPARAEVNVRVTGSGVTKVTAAPYIWNGGEKGAPPPDVLTRTAGDSNMFSTHLWIMRGGSYSVRVHVEGAQGSGTAVVPFVAVAMAVLTMDPKMGWGLAIFGLFLFVGLVTIVGAASRESTLEPGVEPDAARVRRSWVVRLVAAAFITVLLVLGRWWWNVDNAAYARGVYKPAIGTVTVRDSLHTRQLHFTLADSAQGIRSSTPLIPDHGKLMHFFLVKEDRTALAHLHPITRDSLTFLTALPPLPAGKYRVFADVVHESGFTETMVGSAEIPDGGATTTTSDPDDALFAGEATGNVTTFADRATLTWERGTNPIVANQFAPLRFVVRDAKGGAATVEPFLGMAAHAVVVRDSGDVFVHLHPIGTTSMAAQQALMARTDADTVFGAVATRLAENQMLAQMKEQMVMSYNPNKPLPGILSFPYAFPRAGSYRVWVQFRRGGAIHTAAFDATVAAAPAAP